MAGVLSVRLATPAGARRFIPMPQGREVATPHFDKPVMVRLQAHEHAYPDRHLRYTGAGHMIWPLSTPYLPTTVTSRRHAALGTEVSYGGNAIWRQCERCGESGGAVVV